MGLGCMGAVANAICSIGCWLQRRQVRARFWSCVVRRGIGKTALLDYVAQRASGCRVMRAGGAESEMELAFAGLHQLCASKMDRLDRLPGPQRDALGTAFGLSAGRPPDRTAPFHAGRRCHCLVAGYGTLRLLGTRVHVLAASATSRAAETNDSTVGLVSPGRRASDTTAGSASVTGR